MTQPLRKASAQAGDPEGMSLWAGQGYRLAREMPAAELVHQLMEEARRGFEVSRRVFDNKPSGEIE